MELNLDELRALVSSFGAGEDWWLDYRFGDRFAVASPTEVAIAFFAVIALNDLLWFTRARPEGSEP